MQYEVAIDKLKGDMEWQAEKIKMSAEITKKHTFSTQPDVPLTFEKAKLLNTKIARIRDVVLNTMKQA